jgi:hypothetical protein
MNEKVWAGWHFLPADRRIVAHPDAPFGGTLVTPGLTLTLPRNGRAIQPCYYGLHASKRAIDALQYASSGIVTRVRLSGDIVEETDKAAARERTVLWVMDASIALHITAVNVAQVALDRRLAAGDAIDPRSQNALDVKLRWLKGGASDSELAAAMAAAWDAARDAAWDAARAAVWDAAMAAAMAAAWDAAMAAAWDEQNTILETALFTQYETGYGVIR